MNSKIYVYVLKCRTPSGKLGYYVGTWGGDSVHTRWKQHLIGIGSKFCKLNDPISYISVGRFSKSNAFRMENILTAYYMKKVGFRNCRGGNHLNMKPNCYQLSQLLWWIPGCLHKELLRGDLGKPDPVQHLVGAF